MTKDDLAHFFDIVDEDKRAFALDTLNEYLFFKAKCDELRKLPLLRVSTKNPELQQVTPAGKLLKEYSQQVDAKRGALLRILYRVESTAADDLLAKLADYE